MKNKRIFWLLSNETLCQSEVPMLVRLGYEVYVSKSRLSNNKVNYQFDSSLSINHSLLDRLNEFDLYTNKWPKDLTLEINNNFDILITAIDAKTVEMVSRFFNKTILLRSFGLANDNTFADKFKRIFSEKTFNRIRSRQGIWLATSFSNSIDNEPLWMRQNTVYTPQALPLDFYEKNGQWWGGDNTILLLDPQVKSERLQNNSEYKNILIDIPHILKNGHNIDPNEYGFFTEPAKDYVDDMLLISCKATFYPSLNERCLDYDPIKAIIYGMPVVFMSGGALEFLAKEKLPGCCENFEDAKLKIRRILHGDTILIESIISSQKIILKDFDLNYIEGCWKESLCTIAETQEQATRISTDSKSSQLHVGVWIHEFNPNGFTGEGISRLLAMIVKGAQRHPDIKIHLAAVSWVKQAIIDYMGDLGVDTQALSFAFVNEKPPIILKLYNWWINRKPKPKKIWAFQYKLIKLGKDIVKKIMFWLVSLRSEVGFVLIFIILLILSPVVLLLGILVFSLTAIKKIIIKTAALLKNKHYGIDFYKRTIQSAIKLGANVYHIMVQTELKLLAKKYGKDENFSAWFFAYPKNEFISYFKAHKIVAVPDIVYRDFPVKFIKSIDNFEKSIKAIESSITQADRVITFSKYVSQNHVIKPGLQPSNNVFVIRHAPIETRTLISPRSKVDDTEIHLIANRVIKNYLRKEFASSLDTNSDYLASLNIGQFDYLFISAQSRAHKNHLNLLKAYRILLMEEHINLKIIFTGVLSDEMKTYIDEESLHLDVLSFYYMSPMVHASFYACAKLTIAPTLFEGGFPFVFSESLSVKTPVVLSNIPVTREILSEEETEMICFDPYNIQEMAQKISWALRNHSSLLNKELEILERMNSRTWEDVAEDYIRIFSNTGKNASRNSGTMVKQFLLDGKVNQQICFIHIPKTAGTSFTQALINTIGAGSFKIVHPDELAGIQEPDYNLENYFGISGHFSFEIVKLLNKQPILLTFLRNPIDRSISQYKQFTRLKDEKTLLYYKNIYNLKKAPFETTLDEYLQNPLLVKNLANTQTSFLGMTIKQPMTYIKQLWPIQKDHDRDFSLGLAIERIEREVAFLGIQDLFQQSLNMFAYQFHIAPIISSQPKNVSESQWNAKDLPQSTIERLTEINRLDIELYEFGRKLFIKRYDTMVSDLTIKHNQPGDLSVIEMLEKEAGNNK